MLVPMELFGLTHRLGYLSPELAIGWQIGRYVREFFDGLGEVRIAAAWENDAVLALAHLAGEHGHPAQVAVSETRQPWDFLFYHVPTGTVLNFILIRRHVELPWNLRELEKELCADKPELTETYQAGLDNLVAGILGQSAESFCMIRQLRYRPLCRIVPGLGMIGCSRCGKTLAVRDAWEVEGEIRCRDCTGLDPSWLRFH